MRIFHHGQPYMLRPTKGADHPIAKSRFGPIPLKRPDIGDTAFTRRL